MQTISQGGSYIRDPVTGEVTREEWTAEAPPPVIIDGVLVDPASVQEPPADPAPVETAPVEMVAPVETVAVEPQPAETAADPIEPEPTTKRGAR